MAGILDFFRGPAAAGTPSPQPQAQPGPGSNAPAAQPGGGSNPNNPNVPAGTPGGDGGTPVDDWAKMWDTAGKAQGTEQQPQSLFDLKPEQLKEASARMNFVGGVNQELVTKALSGDVSAFMQVLNGVAQNVFAQTSFSGMKLMDTGIQRYSKNFVDAELPKHFQNYTANNGVRSANPVFSDPRYAPMLDTFKGALVAANPTASEQQIQQQAERFLQQLIDDAAKGKPPQAATQPGGNMPAPSAVTRDAQGNDDWTNFFQPMPTGQ